MSKFAFNRLAAKIKSGIPQMLDVMANNAVNQFKIENFDAQAFVDDTPKRWPARKSGSGGRRLLVDTGRGRASIAVLERGQNYRKVGTRVPYMKYHNDGAGRLPQRQFIGESKKLDRKNTKVIHTFIDKTIKSYL